MKTDNVNNETLLVKGSVCVCVFMCADKKVQEKPRCKTRKNELLDNDLCKMANNKRKKSHCKREKSTWRFRAAEMQFQEKHQQKKKQGKKNEPMAATVFEMRSNKREIVFAIYETHGNVQRQLELELKMLFHLSFVHFCIAFYFEIGEETVTETGGDRTAFQTEYTITAMNNINLIWTSALDRAKKWRCFAKRRFSV